MPWFIGGNTAFTTDFHGGLFFLIVWSLLWKGFALWHAAQRKEKWWFIVFLVIHTIGILELLYLLFVVKIIAQKQIPANKK